MATQWVRISRIAALAMGLLVAGCATQVAISGRFPARFPQAAELQRLAVLDFSGSGGRQFTAALQSVLFAAEFDGQRVFTIADTGGRVAPQSSDAARYGRSVGADGVLFGQTSLTSNDQPFQGTERRCSQYDDRRRCVQSYDVTVYCTRRTMTLHASTSMIRSSDGNLAYSSEKSENATTSWCSGGTRRETDEMMAANLRQRIIADIRRDVAPYTAILQATLKESASGLPPLEAGEFKRAVAAAKAQNFGGACEIWTNVDSVAPNHVWTIYNLGVCAEASGDYPLALSRYQRSQVLAGGADRTVMESVTRVNQLMGASAELDDQRRQSAPAQSQRPAPAPSSQQMCTVRDANSGLLVRQPCEQ